MRQFVRAILETTGQYEVLEVTNGFEALRILPRQDFDLIVTDINMPDVSGIELTRFIRGNARHKHVPVLVISTDASAVDAERARQAGASAFLAKPFDGAQLHDAIAEGIAAIASASQEPT